MTRPIVRDLMRGSVVFAISYAALCAQGALGAPSAEPRPHPHLFFTKADLPAIRKRIESGVPREAWLSITRRCEAELKPGSAAAALLEDAGRGDRSLKGFVSGKTRYTNPVMDLAFAWAVSGEAKWGARLRELVHAARQLFPDGLEFLKKGFGASVTTDRGEGMAVVYDLAHDLLTPDERGWFRSALVRHCRDAERAMYKGNLGLGEAYLGWQGANLRPVRANNLAMPALALVGEEGFEEKWVRTAIAEYESFFAAGLGEQGEYHENGSYFGYGMMYGSRGLYALKLAGHDLFANPRLRKCAGAMIHEVTPNGSFNPLNDAEYGSVGFHIDAWRMLNWAYPADPAANWLYREALRFRKVGIGSMTAIMAVLFHRDPSPVDPPRHPELSHHARYLPHAGRVYFRTGWESEDLMASLYSVVTHLGWHGQGDNNSVTLYGRDGRWLIESGYGGELVGPDAHNLVLIDGIGPPSRVYPGSGGAIWCGAGDITQFLAAEWASLAEGDARQAYAFMSWYKEGMMTYPYCPVAKALRQMVFVDSAAGVPPFFLIHDDIQKDKDEHVYEWRFHTPYENRVEVGEAGVTLENRFNGDYYENNGEPSGKWIEQEFELNRPGRYRVFAVARSPRYTTAYVHARLDRKHIGYSSTSSPFWRPLPVVKKPIDIAAGKHVLSLRQSWSTLRLAGAILVAEGKSARLKDSYTAPDEVFIRFDESAKAEEPWRRVIAKDSCCEVTFLRPSKVAISCADYEKKGHWRTTAQTLVRAKVRARNPGFLVLAYPYRAGMERPRVCPSDEKHPGYQASLKWQGATDYISVFDSSATRTYDGIAGGTWTPLPSSSLPAVAGQLALVRSCTDGDPAKLRFLAVSAARLSFGERVLVDVLDPAGYTAVTLVNSGQVLTIHALIRPDSIWQVSRKTHVKVYGPLVRRVIVEQESAAFERNGDYVIVPIIGRRRVTHKQKIEARIERVLNER